MDFANLSVFLKSDQLHVILQKGEELEKRIPELEEAIHRLTVENQQLTKKVEVVETRLGQAMKREENLKNELVEHQEKVDALNKELAQAKSERDAANSAINQMKQHPSIQRAERERVQNQIKELSQHLAKLPDPDAKKTKNKSSEAENKQE